MAWCRNAILSAGVALGLSACNFFEGMDFSFNQVGCAFYPETKVGSVNWDTARSRSMRIRQGEYWPMITEFTAEQPYVLRIANADLQDRTFRASAFFDSVAVGLVRVGNRDYDTTCLSAITIGPRETAEIWFVAKRDGRYEFEDQLVPYFFSQGASGVIHISNARKRHVSPVSYLVVPESVPTAPIIAPRKSSAPGSQPPPPSAAPRPAVAPAPLEIPAAPLEIPAAPVTPTSQAPANTAPANKAPAKAPSKEPDKKPQQNPPPNPQTSEVLAKDQGGLAEFLQSLFQ